MIKDFNSWESQYKQNQINEGVFTDAAKAAAKKLISWGASSAKRAAVDIAERGVVRSALRYLPKTKSIGKISTSFIIKDIKNLGNAEITDSFLNIQKTIKNLKTQGVANLVPKISEEIDDLAVKIAKAYSNSDKLLLNECTSKIKDINKKIKLISECDTKISIIHSELENIKGTTEAKKNILKSLDDVYDKLESVINDNSKNWSIKETNDTINGIRKNIKTFYPKISENIESQIDEILKSTSSSLSKGLSKESESIASSANKEATSLISATSLTDNIVNDISSGASPGRVINNVSKNIPNDVERAANYAKSINTTQIAENVADETIKKIPGGEAAKASPGILKKIFKSAKLAVFSVYGVLLATQFISDQIKKGIGDEVVILNDTNKESLGNKAKDACKVISVNRKASEVNPLLTYDKLPKDLIITLSENSSLKDTIISIIDSVFKKPFDYFSEIGAKINDANNLYGFCIAINDKIKLNKLLSSIEEKGLDGFSYFTDDNGYALKFGSHSVASSDEFIEAMVGSSLGKGGEKEITELLEESKNFTYLFKEFKSKIKSNVPKTDITNLLNSEENATITYSAYHGDMQSLDSLQRCAYLPTDNGSSFFTETIITLISGAKTENNPLVDGNQNGYMGHSVFHSGSFDTCIEGMKRLTKNGDDFNFTSNLLNSIWLKFDDIAQKQIESNTNLYMFSVFSSGLLFEIMKSIIILNMMNSFCLMATAGAINENVGITESHEIKRYQSFLQQTEIAILGESKVIPTGIMDEETESSFKKVKFIVGLDGDVPKLSHTEKLMEKIIMSWKENI